MSSNHINKLKAHLMRKLRSKLKTQNSYTALIRNYYRKSKRRGYFKKLNTKKKWKIEK